MPTDFSNANRQPMQQLNGSQAEWDAAPKPVLAIAQFAVIWDTGRVFVGTASGDLEIGVGQSSSGPQKIPKEDYQIAFESRSDTEIVFEARSTTVARGVSASTGFYAAEIWDGSVLVLDDTRRQRLLVPTSGQFAGNAPKIIKIWSATSATDATPSGNFDVLNLTGATNQITDINLDAAEISNTGDSGGLIVELESESLFVDGFSSPSIEILGSLKHLTLANSNLIAQEAFPTNIRNGLQLAGIGLESLTLENTAIAAAYHHSSGPSVSTREVNISDNNMDAAALNAFAEGINPHDTSARYSSGLLEVGNNPGSATFDTTILTNKGYTVLGV